MTDAQCFINKLLSNREQEFLIQARVNRPLRASRQFWQFNFLMMLAKAFGAFFRLSLRFCVVGLFAGQSQWLDGLAKSLGYESVFHHAVIIDAGSSGSRVLAYKFRVPFTGESYFHIILFVLFQGYVSVRNLQKYFSDCWYLCPRWNIIRKVFL